MCAELRVRLNAAGMYEFIETRPDPTGKCKIFLSGTNTPTCFNEECEGECLLLGPFAVEGTDDLFDFKCCCEGGAVAGGDGGCDGCSHGDSSGGD